MIRLAFLYRICIAASLVFPALDGTAQTKPTVVSTNPANGAKDVPASIRSFSVTFSKPMVGGCGSSTSNWLGAGGPGSSCQWSADGRTMTVTRGSEPQFLSSGSTITVTLNPPGSQFLRDSEGNVLDTYVFSLAS